MANQKNRQKQLSQNFFVNKTLVRRIVQESSISSSDTVYEIGPGEGILTIELAKKAHRVIAIEKDWRLLTQVRQKFRENDQVKLIQGDFLSYQIREKHFKIFANIPFSITSDIVRKILMNNPKPEEAYLVMQKQAAERYVGVPQETLFSLLIKPEFETRVIRKFRRTDFSPVPGVDSVLLHIKKHTVPLVPQKDIPSYECFIRYGFRSWKKSLKLTYKPIFTYSQWKRLCKEFGFAVDVTPTELSFDQWLGVFHCFQEHVSADRKMLIWR